MFFVAVIALKVCGGLCLALVLFTVLSVLSSFAIILIGKREPVA